MSQHDNKTDLHPMENFWSVYIIRCDDGSLYTGVSTDPQRRFNEHAGNSRGAKFFNGRKPVSIVWQEGQHTRSSAQSREAEIKQLSRAQKLQLIEMQGNQEG